MPYAQRRQDYSDQPLESQYTERLRRDPSFRPPEGYEIVNRGAAGLTVRKSPSFFDRNMDKLGFTAIAALGLGPLAYSLLAGAPAAGAAAVPSIGATGGIPGGSFAALAGTSGPAAAAAIPSIGATGGLPGLAFGMPSVGATGGIPAGAFPAIAGTAGPAAAAPPAAGGGFGASAKTWLGKNALQVGSLGAMGLSGLMSRGGDEVPYAAELQELLQMQKRRMQQADPLYQAILRMAMGLLPAGARANLASGSAPRSGGSSSTSVASRVNPGSR
jgi:hypothetical protein